MRQILCSCGVEIQFKSYGFINIQIFFIKVFNNYQQSYEQLFNIDSLLTLAFSLVTLKVSKQTRKIMAQYNANGITGYGVGSPQIGLAPVPEKWNRAPTTSDLGFPYGYLAIYNGTVYASAGASAGLATWVILGGSASDVNTINHLSPTAGNIDITGTTNRLDVSSVGSTINLNLPNTVSGLTGVNATSFVTSSVTKGTTYSANTIDATGSDTNINIEINPKGSGSLIQSRGLAGGDITIEATNTDNTNAASRAGLEVAVGGTSAGDPYINFLVSGAGQYTIGIDNSVSDNFVVAASGSLGTSNVLSITSVGDMTASGSITSALGSITATNGNFVMSTNGNKLVIPFGANCSLSSDTLVNGVIAVSNTAVTANSKIFLSRDGLNASTAIGELIVSAIVGGGFTVTSTRHNTLATETGDQSTFYYWIVN